MSKKLSNQPNRSKSLAQKRAVTGRNAKILDLWSVVHFLTGVVFGWIITPFVAIVIMILWEPLEILILSKALARFNIDFGYESIKNSLSDIVVDLLGIALGYYLLLQIFSPPFHLF